MQGISWPTVCYMLGEAQYGGRVTDDFDKRLLLTFTQLWFSERLLLPNFEFYRFYALPPQVLAPLPSSSSSRSRSSSMSN